MPQAGWGLITFVVASFALVVPCIASCYLPSSSVVLHHDGGNADADAEMNDFSRFREFAGNGRKVRNADHLDGRTFPDDE